MFLEYGQEEVVEGFPHHPLLVEHFINPGAFLGGLRTMIQGLKGTYPRGPISARVLLFPSLNLGPGKGALTAIKPPSGAQRKWASGCQVSEAALTVQMAPQMSPSVPGGEQRRLSMARASFAPLMTSMIAHFV